MEEIFKEKQELLEKLEQIQNEKEKMSKAIEEKTNELLTVDRVSTSLEYSKSCKEVYNALDETAKQVLSERRAIEKSINNCRVIGIIIVLIYAVLAVAIFTTIEADFGISKWLIYALSVAVVRLIYTLSTKKTLNKHKAKLAENRKNPIIIEYDKKITELYKQYVEKNNKTTSYIKKLEEEKKLLITENKRLLEEEKALSAQIEEFDFNYAYKDVILFYGTTKGNRYHLYLDGLLYDTVKGHQIITIMLSPGLHSFKVDDTCYNIDGSVIYCHDFNTIQIMAGEGMQSYPFICEHNLIREVNGSEFQRITKRKLI